MQLLKLTVLSSLLFAFAISFTSCEKEAEKKKTTLYVKTGLPITFAQEVPLPPVPSSAIGSLDVSYDKVTKILTYKFNWSGLTGPVTVFHIHGLAPTGFGPAGVIQTFVNSAIVPCTPGAPTSCGSYSGTFLADGVKVKEDDILNGLYYVNIHTAANPSGEIKGQIRFQ